MKLKSEIRDIVIGLLDKQIEKGVSTYGHTLDQCPDEKYDWNVMTLEEVVDALQYQIKQNMVMQKELNKKEVIIQHQATTIRLLGGYKEE